MRGRREITFAQDLALGQGNRLRGMQLFRKSSRNPLLQVQVLWGLYGPELGVDFLPLSGALFRSALPKPEAQGHPGTASWNQCPPVGGRVDMETSKEIRIGQAKEMGAWWSPYRTRQPLSPPGTLRNNQWSFQGWVQHYTLLTQKFWTNYIFHDWI